MADVNEQITDAVTQTNVKVLGESPAQSMGMVYQTLAHSLSLAMQNAQHSQGGLTQISNAITASGVTMIMNAVQQQGGSNNPPATPNQDNF